MSKQESEQNTDKKAVFGVSSAGNESHYLAPMRENSMKELRLESYNATKSEESLQRRSAGGCRSSVSTRAGLIWFRERE